MSNSGVQSSVNFALATNVNSLVLTGSANLSGSANSGNDTLVSNSGVDTLIGGAGNDIFVVNNSADVVQDGSTTANNSIQSSVSYVLPANVNTLVLTGTSNLAGTANSGNDTLVSNSGVDTLVGGSGNDTFVVNNASDVVQDSSATASNTVQASVSYVLPTNVNTLVLTGSANLSATGNGASDVLAANAGADTLIAGAGVATLIGGTGNDTFIVNNIADVVQEGSINTNSTIQSSVSYTLATNVNTLILTGTGGLTATANAGNDTIVSNSGVDTLVGGAGNDLFVVNNSADVLLNLTANDTIVSSVSFALPSGFNGLVLTGSANISATGNAGNDTLTAGAGNDTLIAGSGVATLIGGSGNTTFVINNAGDVVRDNSTTTSNTIQASVSYTLPTNVDTLVLTGSASLNATGNTDASNVLTANAGTDHLYATASATTINGGVGTDYIYAGPGANVIHAGNGGTSSQPTQVYGNATGTGVYTQSTIYGGSGTDIITGGAGSDLIYAGTGATTINSGSGFDTIYGNSGSVISDTLSGYDLMVAGSGNETLAGFGADTLVAGSGSDLLTGGSATTVQINPGFGVTTVYGPQNIAFGAGIAASDFSVTTDANADVILTGDGGSILLPGALIPIALSSYANTTGSIGSISGVVNDTFAFADGSSRSLSSLVAGLGVPGSFTHISGSPSTQLIFNTGSNQSLRMTGANDTLVSSRNNDAIYGVSMDTLASYWQNIPAEFYVTGNGDSVYGSAVPYVSTEMAAAGSNDLLVAAGTTDHLVAMGANDTLSAGGSSVLEVNDASTVVQVSSPTNGVLVLSGVSYTTPTNVWSMQLVKDYIVGTANNLGDSLSTYRNYDTLISGAGSDTLAAWGKGDVLIGGSGVDQFWIYDSTDVIQFGSKIGLDTVYAAANYTLADGAINLVIVGSGDVGTGNSQDDHLSITNGNDKLIAGSGNDTLDSGTNQSNTLVGGAGNDVFIVGASSDVVVDAFANTQSVIFSSASFTLPTNVNTLTLTGSAALSGTGNSQADLITANAGNDTLVAGSGNDTLVAGVGSDTFKFNLGYTTDDVRGPLKAATIVFGTGILQSDLTFAPILNTANSPSLRISGKGGAVTVEGGLVPGVIGNVQFGDGSVLSLKQLIAQGAVGPLTVAGSSGNLILSAADSASITGGAGTDTISTWGNNDTIFAGAGANIVYAGGSADSVVGGSGNSTLVAIGLNDTLVAGTGTQSLIINDTSDLVQGPAVVGNDTLFSSVSYTLPANLTRLTLIGSGNLQATGNTLNDVITANSGTDTLIAGAGIDTFVGGAGNDLFVVNNSADVVQVAAGTGTDAIQSSVNYVMPANIASLLLTGTADLAATGSAGGTVVANTGNDTLTAGAGAETLIGGTGNDSLVGGSGNDSLVSGGYYDTLVGGSGIDTFSGVSGTFVITSSSDVVQAPASNSVRAFSSVNYTLTAPVSSLTLTGSANLTASDGGFAGVTVTGNTGNDTLISTGNLGYLISGSGIDTLVGSATGTTFTVNNSADIVQAAAGTYNPTTTTVSWVLPSDVNSISLSGTSNLVVTGNSGPDVFFTYLSSGDDTLIAGSGLATLYGGAGNDTFVVNNSADVVQDSTTGKNNVVQSSANFVLPTNVNTLLLTGTANLTGTGNSAADTLTANAGSDTLVAGSGNDTLIAGSGLVTMIGGAGTDTFVINNTGDVVQDATTGKSNVVKSSVSYVMPTNINTLTLTGTANIVGTGNTLAGKITANSGNDTLTAGTGVATLVGGAGNDTFVINSASDVIQDAVTTTANTLQSSVSYVLPTNVQTLVLTGTAALTGTGNTVADRITANSGADTLTAGTGVATLVGGSGNDTFVVNNVADVVQDASTTATNTIRASVSYVLPTNVNTLVLTGTAALSGTGNAGADTITANSGNDTLVAGAGVATLIGGAGTDTFVVNNALDVVQDATTGKSNVVQSSVSYVMPTNINTLTLTGTANLTGTGNSAAGKITANSGSDTLIAGGGVATLVGGSGNDTFVVNNASDVVQDAVTTTANIIQSSVSYVLPTNVQSLVLTGTAALTGTGNTVADRITANSGADTLTAGTGVATLVGGSGNDTFVVNNVADVVQDASTTATNAIQSSVSYVLPTNVNTLTLTGTAALTGTGNAGVDKITANSGNDTLVAGTGVATLIGGAGTDTFVVNNALDVVQDATTGKSNVVQSSVSYVMPTNINTLTLTGTANLTGTGNTAAGKITANSGNDTLIAGTGVATLVGGGGNDTFVINNASDVIQDAFTTTANTVQSSVSYVLPTNVQSLVLTGTAALTGTGNASTGLIIANNGADTLTGGAGVAVLEGGAGLDSLIDTAGQGALIGGAGADTMTGGTHKSFFAAGMVSDSITTGATNNVVAVNKGHGATTLQPTTGAVNVLSLGGGIDTENLKFTKTGNNLILSDGVTGDTITFTNWYASASNQTFTKLQVIELASASYSAASSDALRNQAIEEFNFTSLVTQFNSAGSPANWALSTGMPTAQLTSSATLAYGGDLAYYYGLNNNLTSLNLSAAQSTLTNASFATATQTVDAWASVSGGGSTVHLNSVKAPTATALIVTAAAVADTAPVSTTPTAMSGFVTSDRLRSHAFAISRSNTSSGDVAPSPMAEAVGSAWATMHSYFDQAAASTGWASANKGLGQESINDHAVFAPGSLVGASAVDSPVHRRAWSAKLAANNLV